MRIILLLVSHKDEEKIVTDFLEKEMVKWESLSVTVTILVQFNQVSPCRTII
jgi:hypothetical protein